MFRNLVVLAIGLMPDWGVKHRLLTIAFGWNLDRDTVLNPCVFWNVGTVTIGRGAHLGLGSVYRDIRALSLGPGASIGNFNWVSGTSADLDQEDAELAGSLVLAGQAAITSRHYLDCSGGIEVGELAILGGVRSTLLTHGLDVGDYEVGCKPIKIGASTLVHSGVTLAPGAVVPARCAVAAGAVVSKALEDELTLYGGVPARKIRAYDSGEAFFNRTTTSLRAAEKYGRGKAGPRSRV